MAAHLKTTVVGSYPVLPWMVGNPSRLVLRDAVMAVLKTQELAGLDLVTDGELMRFDPSHPEANGMVDYFVRGWTGSGALLPRRFRTLPRRSRLGLSVSLAGCRRRPDHRRHLNLPQRRNFRAPSRAAFKFT